MFRCIITRNREPFQKALQLQLQQRLSRIQLTELDIRSTPGVQPVLFPVETYSSQIIWSRQKTQPKNEAS